MKIYLGGDHAGYELKKTLIAFINDELKHETIDEGPHEYDENDDYPDFVSLVAKNVQAEDGSFGIVIGGSGQGEAMCANRFKGIRAAVYYGGDLEIVKLSKEHNNANILSLGARFLNEEEVKEAVRLWLETKFSEDERHVRRIAKLDK